MVAQPLIISGNVQHLDPWPLRRFADQHPVVFDRRGDAGGGIPAPLAIGVALKNRERIVDGGVKNQLEAIQCADLSPFKRQVLRAAEVGWGGDPQVGQECWPGPLAGFVRRRVNPLRR